MKKLVVLALLMLAGCGSVDNNEPKEIKGEWSGVVFDDGVWMYTLELRVEDNFAIGSMKILIVEHGSSKFHATSGIIVGNADSFSMHLQVGPYPTNTWAYTGYIENERLCLIRDALPDPVRCLDSLA